LDSHRWTSGQPSATTAAHIGCLKDSIEKTMTSTDNFAMAKPFTAAFFARLKKRGALAVLEKIAADTVFGDCFSREFEFPYTCVINHR
jgi:hypothetical protein